MSDEIESPRTPDDLYRARGDDVMEFRPILTGDVFAGVLVGVPGEEPKKRDVMIIQHPCALRTNGIDLIATPLVAKVQQFPAFTREKWAGSTKLMPLPELRPNAATEKKRHAAALFDSLYLVSAQELQAAERIACLETTGLNLLLQRWVHHSTRATIGTHVFHEANIHVYEESDLIEDWCLSRTDDGLSVRAATAECLEWLREDKDGTTRQDLLKDPQRKSVVRQQASGRTRELRRLER